MKRFWKFVWNVPGKKCSDRWLCNIPVNIYVRDHILYVSLTSAVLRSELTLCRERLVKSLNEYAGATVIHDIIIR